MILGIASHPSIRNPAFRDINARLAARHPRG